LIKTYHIFISNCIVYHLYSRERETAAVSGPEDDGDRFDLCRT